MKKKYVFIGASGRALYMYAQPMVSTFAHCAEAVGIFDTNMARAETVKRLSGLSCPCYADCDRMLAETKPDAAIITTVDKLHHEYAIKCMEASVDVILEKPMTIDAEKCRAILETQKRTGRDLAVTFNYRYTPYVTAIKQAIRDGVVGTVLNVDFEYMLDTKHGADYFRRWHRRKENSGGLLVHKSTHHFDLINWWIEDEPTQVMAFGNRGFYGHTRDERGERCLTCKHKETCGFYWDIATDEFTRKLYLECEEDDGYHRDQCVFSDEIDMEDTMSVNVRYSGGPMLSYSLIAHSPYEGWKASINGAKGRLEAAEYHSGLRESDAAFYFDVYNRKGEKITHTIPKVEGAHGGGDKRLLKMLFEGADADPLGHVAGSFAGSISVLIGIAANLSIAEGRSVTLDDLVRLDEYRPGM